VHVPGDVGVCVEDTNEPDPTAEFTVWLDRIINTNGKYVQQSTLEVMNGIILMTDDLEILVSGRKNME